MKYIFAFSILFAFNLYASEAGGDYDSLENVLKKEDITAIVAVKINGYKKQDIVEVSKVFSKKKLADHEVVYSESSYKKVSIDASLISTINGKVTSKPLKNITYTETFFEEEYTISKKGKQPSGPHSLGYLYTGSGKEFTEKVCAPDIKVILIIATAGEKEYILRAEPYSHSMLKKITQLIKL